MLTFFSTMAFFLWLLSLLAGLGLIAFGVMLTAALR